MSTKQEEKPHIQQIDPFAQVEVLAASQSKFLKIQPGQTMLLSFDKDKFKPVEREIDGKKSNAVEYTVFVTPGSEKGTFISPF